MKHGLKLNAAGVVAGVAQVAVVMEVVAVATAEEAVVEADTEAGAGGAEIVETAGTAGKQALRIKSGVFDPRERLV